MIHGLSIETNKKSELPLISLGKFCLLLKRNKESLKQLGIHIKGDEYYLSLCSDAVSEVLRIMDACQRALWTFTFDEKQKPQMKQLSEIYQECLEVIQSLTNAFTFAVGTDIYTGTAYQDLQKELFLSQK